VLIISSQKKKKIDILVNNAGVALAGFAETTEDEQIEKIFDINFMGVVRMFRAVLPFMRSRKSGHIISISSTSAVSPPTGLGFYAASKAALETFHSSEAPILAQWNIKLTILQVGTTITNDKHMAEKVELGQRSYTLSPDERDLYKIYLINKKKDYADYVRNYGRNVYSVVNQIINIIDQPDKVDPIEQTSGEAAILGRMLYVDPTGKIVFQGSIASVETYLHNNL